MRNIIEYPLVSLDSVFAGAAISGFSEYRDEVLMGRTTYEDFDAPTRGLTESMPHT